MKKNVAFLSVVPSPYQRDLFRALAARTEISLRVFYLEASAPDSPWPEKPLEDYEQILPGFWLPLGSARLHVNWRLPDFSVFDIVVLNTLISPTAQRLMRFHFKNKTWFFWGERLRPRAGWKKSLHDFMIAPLRKATGIAGIGSRAAADYGARFPGVEIFCVPYYCELQPFLDAPRPPKKNGEIVFLFCGQMIARKGVDLLLAAFARVAAGNKNARLLLVGREAELPELLEKIDADTRAKISYAGFQPPEKLPAFFAQADVFILPSRYDGWGVVVNQALGAGLPVICSDAAGAGHDLVAEEINGLKFESDNAASLVEKMQRFVTEPALAARMAAESRRMALDMLPVKGAEKWIEIFQKARHP
jgi:glycosyltransferase involved in cell wall biosynthesis